MPRLPMLVSWIAGLALCGFVFTHDRTLSHAPLDTEITHTFGDDWDWQLTTWEAGRAQLREGVLPTFSPFTEGGVPLLGNPESPTLYPPYLVTLGLSTSAAMKVLMALHWVLLVVGFYAAGRELGLGPLAAHGGALGLLASSFLPEFVGWGHQMFLAIGWAPLAFVAARRDRPLLAGGALAMPLLFGAHYVFFFALLWLALDAVGRAVEPSRLAWLVPGLAMNVLWLGAGPDHAASQALAVPVVAVLLFGGLAMQRRRVSPDDAATPLLSLAAILLVAAALCAPKLIASAELVAVAERLDHARVRTGLTFPYDLRTLWFVANGVIERPAGHEGMNVFFSPVPLGLGGVGLIVGALRWPRAFVPGLALLSVGLADASPVNLLQAIHRIPGFDRLDKIERYTLLWTPFLGWGLGALVAFFPARVRAAVAAVVLVAVASWMRAAEPHFAVQVNAVAPAPRFPPGPYRQVAGGLVPTYQGVRSGVGRVDGSIAAPIGGPAPGIRTEGAAGYLGEAYLLGPAGDRVGATPLVLRAGGSVMDVDVPRAGRVVLNLNHFAGWGVSGGLVQPFEGLVAAELPAGTHRFRHWPRGLGPALFLWLVGLALVGRDVISALRSWSPPAGSRGA